MAEQGNVRILPTRTRVRITRPLAALAFLVLLVGLIFGPLFRHVIFGTPTQLPVTDYSAHSAYAHLMRHTRRPTVPHFLYHGLLISARAAQEKVTGHVDFYYGTPIRDSLVNPRDPILAEIHYSYRWASWLVMMLSTQALAIVLWAIFRRATARDPDRPNAGAEIAAALLAIAFLLLGPVALFVTSDHRFYLGYVPANVWHNPTAILVKPLALLGFYFAARAFDGERPVGIGAVATAAALTILGALAKPSYTICLLPASAVFAAIWLLRGRKIHWGLLLAGGVVPAIAVLIWQYKFTYPRSGSAIKLAPLLTLSLYSTHLGWKLLLSLVFPLCAYAVHFRVATRSVRLNFAWVAFIIGETYALLLAEVPRAGDGNFTWSAQVALFILFVESVLLVLRLARVSVAAEIAPGQSVLAPPRILPLELRGTRRGVRTGRLIVCAAAFALHLGYGAGYYAHVLKGSAMSRSFPYLYH